jgi:hypothetical protein
LAECDDSGVCYKSASGGGNDRWLEGKAKRTYLKDDGTPFEQMAAEVSRANQAALKAAYVPSP